MANRLAASMSPYLQQHANNPVDWYEWGEQAFAAARERDVPILLSVGYAACHWCHVMAHESFEDQQTASVMNERFVNVKVDREERPDVDAVYMAAVQAMTGHGGWPMTVFLTPDAAPFFAGTYFPPVPRHGSASFAQVLMAVSEAWSERRAAVEEAGAGAVQRLLAANEPLGEGAAFDLTTLDQAALKIIRSFDAANGGFGHAPKFPPSMTVEHLLRHHQRTGSPDALHVARRTLDVMARGGLYDQLGGGFARYSVDAQWIVPHFEKMLYDNALLLGAYVSALVVTGDELYRRVASETADFLLTEMRTHQGAFAASLDADTEGVEGRYYVWTPSELGHVLDADDAQWAAEFFQVTPSGTFEDGASVLQRRTEPDDTERLDRIRSSLKAARSQRPAPARDDKIVAAWNGLVITALTRAGVILQRPELVAAAVDAATVVYEVHVEHSGERARLRRVSRDGTAGSAPGVLEDYACVAGGWLSLFAATGDVRWFTRARDLIDAALHDFVDEAGRFVDTATHAESLVARPADAADNAAPSGASALAAACVTLAGLTGSNRYRDAAERALAQSAAIAGSSPRFAGWALATAEALADGPVQIAIVGAAKDPAAQALVEQAFGASRPGAVVAWAAEPNTSEGLALLEGRVAQDGTATAFACQGFVCQLPVTTPQALTAVLDAMAQQG